MLSTFLGNWQNGNTFVTFSGQCHLKQVTKIQDYLASFSRVGSMHAIEMAVFAVPKNFLLILVAF